MQDLTKRQRMVLDFINQSIGDRGYPPTLREIGSHMGIRSTNGVNDHLRALERKGFIKREDMRSRALPPVHTSEFIVGKKRVWKDAPVRYDVFVCYHSEDKQEVREIVKRLRDAGLEPWFDEWEIRPGLSWQDALEDHIEKVSSAAVFIGSSGVGPWQAQEIKAFLREFVERNCPVIPVLLKKCRSQPKLPIFLKGLQWVDFRQGEPEPFGQLLWGISGVKN
jgi:SOS-response transcriptional repressor LexA